MPEAQASARAIHDLGAELEVAHGDGAPHAHAAAQAYVETAEVELTNQRRLPVADLVAGVVLVAIECARRGQPYQALERQRTALRGASHEQHAPAEGHVAETCAVCLGGERHRRVAGHEQVNR